MGFYKYVAPDSNLIQYAGGAGKALAYLGKSLSDIDDDRKKAIAEKARFDLEMDKYLADKLHKEEEKEHNDKVLEETIRNNKDKNRIQENYNNSRIKNDNLLTKIKASTAQTYKKQVDLQEKNKYPFGQHEDGTPVTKQEFGEELVKQRKLLMYGKNGLKQIFDVDFNENKPHFPINKDKESVLFK